MDLDDKKLGWKGNEYWETEVFSVVETLAVDLSMNISFAKCLSSTSRWFGLSYLADLSSEILVHLFQAGIISSLCVLLYLS